MLVGGMANAVPSIIAREPDIVTPTPASVVVVGAGITMCEEAGSGLAMDMPFPITISGNIVKTSPAAVTVRVWPGFRSVKVSWLIMT